MTKAYKKYTEYKDSGIEWLGEIPSHWEVTSSKRLLCIPITDGPHTTPLLLEDGIPFISAESVKNGVIDFDKKRGYISLADHIQYCLKYKPQRGDIYMIKSGATTGNVAIVETDEEFSIWSPLAVFRPNTNMISNKYLYYSLQSCYFKKGVELSWSFGTQQNIGMGILGNLPITYAPLSEQEKIAEFLDKKTADIDTAIAQKEQLIELLKERKQILINKAVTRGLNPDVELKDSGIDWIGSIPKHWEVRKLKYCAKILNGLDCDKQTEGLYPVYGSGGIFGWYNDFLYEGPSVLLGRKGTIDKPQLVLNPFWTVDTAFYTKINKSVVHIMYFYYLCTTIPFEYYSSKTALPSMTQTDLYNTKFAIPPLSEQEEIVNYIEEHSAKIDKAIALKQQEIEALKEYKSTLIDSAVRGKICLV